MNLIKLRIFYMIACQSFVTTHLIRGKRLKCILFRKQKYFLQLIHVIFQTFNPNDYLLRQNQNSRKAFIILQGECELVRKRTTQFVILKKNLQEELQHQEVERNNENLSSDVVVNTIPTEESLFSTQVGPPGSPLKYKIKNNQYSSVEIKLGRLTTKSWLGEDSILLGKPMRYSAIAINKMKVLEITEEFFQKIPKEIKIQLSKISKTQKSFLKERYNVLCDANRGIEKNTSMVYQTLNHIGRAYPQATQTAVKSFQKNHLKISNFNPKVM